MGRVDDSTCVCARGGGVRGGGLLEMPIYTDDRRHLWKGWQAEEKARARSLLNFVNIPHFLPCHIAQDQNEGRNFDCWSGWCGSAMC